uniref:Membrane metallo-endopeptidase-like 1 n=1 Tax=Drosophila rhopaloa TaxID=1041015 RepID=A0A6P4E948_DRORH
MDHILRIMDETANPCTNFKEYSTGRTYLAYFNNYSVPAFDNLNRKFYAVFEQLKNRAYESGSPEEKVFKLYNACQADQKKEKKNSYLEVVQPDINLSWPQNTPQGSQWPKERFQWLVTLGRLRRFGMDDDLLKMSVQVDSEDHSNYTVVIKKPRYLHYEDWLHEVGFTKSKATFLNEEIRKLRDNLNNENDDKPLKKRLTLLELESQHGVSLNKYLEVVFDRKFPPSFKLQIDDVNYLVRLNQLISSSDQEAVAVLLMERFIDFMTLSDRLDASYDCGIMVRDRMEFASNLIFEEHILGFDQSQPNFTDKSVEQLFFLFSAQTNFVSECLTLMPTFAETFNCSSSS